MVETYAAIVRRGDQTEQYVEAQSSSDEAVGGYSIMLYVNVIWLKNYYGEALFYEDDDRLDIFGVVAPRFGRVVVWDSSIPYLSRPPSVTTLSGQFMIFAHYHSDPKTVFEKRTYFYDFMEDLKVKRCLFYLEKAQFQT